MSLAWLTSDYRREDWPRVKPNLRSGITIARWYVRAAWKSVIGFIIGFTLALALLNLIQAQAEQEIIVDLTTAPITAPSPAGDSDLLISCLDGPPATGPRGAEAIMKRRSVRRKNATRSLG